MAPTHIPGHHNQPRATSNLPPTLSSFPHRAWPAPPPPPSVWTMDDAPCQRPTLYPVPKAKMTTAFLPRSSLLPKKRSLLGNPLGVSLLPSYLYWDLPAAPRAPLQHPRGAGALSRAPHPRAGRQRRARASLEPLGCLLRLPTASVPGEVSKASDPRTGMRKASSKQSQLPAPAQGGDEGRAAGPAPRHGTARHGTARPGTAALPRGLPMWAPPG